MQSVLTSKSLNIETTVITNPKINVKTKQLTAGIINVETKSALYIETPYLINPFGVSSYDGGKTTSDDQKTYSLSLKADGGSQYDNKEEIEYLFNFLKELDTKAIDYAIVNSLQIFKKKYSADDEKHRDLITTALYNSCVKPSIGSDGKVYPDKITLKIMKNEQMLPEVMVFKDSPTPLEINSWESLQNIVPKGTALKAIIQPKIYFVNGKMGVNFRVLQIKLPNIEKIGRPVTYAFSEKPVQQIETLDESDKNNKSDKLNESLDKNNETNKINESNKIKNNESDKNKVVDSEEENSDEDSEVEVDED